MHRLRIAAVGALVLILSLGCTRTISGNGSLASASAGMGSVAAPVGMGAVVHKEFPDRTHQEGTVQYSESPPMGGKHNSVWADCTGTIYRQPIPNENAVHSLEHGAVWITYSPSLSPQDIAALENKVRGQNYTLMSPYPGLDRPISLQTWGNQLKLDSAHDPTIDEFINQYRRNPQFTPETNATCVNPEFPGQ